MLTTQTPWNLVAEGYAATTSKLVEGYARAAVDLTKIHPGSHILDVACGPGTLPLLVHEQCASIKAIDFAEQMVAKFQHKLTAGTINNIEIVCGDGQDLPFENDVFDAAFSMFGLMFFPDRQKGYAEIYRTLKPGGEVVVSSWAPVSDSPAMQVMFGAIRAMNPDIPEPQTVIDSLENDVFFKSELEQAGFKQVKIHRVTQHYSIESVAGLWDELVKGSAPIAMMKQNMPADVWQEKEAIALAFLTDALSELPASLASDAWLGYGVK
jgi:SAM-dependent methyltransferase